MSLSFHVNTTNSCDLQAPVNVPCSTSVHLSFISLWILQVCPQQQRTTAGVAPLPISSIRSCRVCTLAEGLQYIVLVLQHAARLARL